MTSVTPPGTLTVTRGYRRRWRSVQGLVDRFVDGFYAVAHSDDFTSTRLLQRIHSAKRRSSSSQAGASLRTVAAKRI